MAAFALRSILPRILPSAPEAWQHPQERRCDCARTLSHTQEHGAMAASAPERCRALQSSFVFRFMLFFMFIRAPRCSHGHRPVGASLQQLVSSLRCAWCMGLYIPKEALHLGNQPRDAVRGMNTCCKRGAGGCGGLRWPWTLLALASCGMWQTP